MAKLVIYGPFLSINWPIIVHNWAIYWYVGFCLPFLCCVLLITDIQKILAKNIEKTLFLQSILCSNTAWKYMVTWPKGEQVVKFLPLFLLFNSSFFNEIQCNFQSYCMSLCCLAWKWKISINFIFEPIMANNWSINWQKWSAKD